MKLLKILPLALCYLVFCGCTGDDHDGHEHHDGDGHEHHDDDGHEHHDDDGHDHDKDHDKDTDSKPASQPAKKTGKLDTKSFDHFGEGVHEGKVLTPSEVAAAYPGLKGQVRIKGEVTDVCKNRGCWLVVRDGKAQVRIKAHCGDWGVPKDSTGRTAIAEGSFAEITEAERKHYESESENGSNPTVTLQAVGVAMAK